MDLSRRFAILPCAELLTCLPYLLVRRNEAAHQRAHHRIDGREGQHVRLTANPRALSLPPRRGRVADLLAAAVPFPRGTW
jgi:hypothetical protein